MADTTHGRNDAPAPICVNLVEPQKLAYWIGALQVSEEELRRLVAEVGPVAADLRIALGQR